METIIDEPRWVRRGSWFGCPLGGALLGAGLYAVAGWVVSLAWFPMQGPFKLIVQIPRPWGLLGLIAVGLVAGWLFAAVWAEQRLIVTVAPGSVRLQRGKKKRRIEAEVTAVFKDDKELVLLGVEGRELVREKADLAEADLAKGFTEHGFPWQDEPPAER
ncbi:YqeB family protein [Amycolatopsis samaneae]|uniref:YqeB PH domain-containing protein n=1 Tax=Amycolatopsis samaneae TaxID=664691 RepID=A0ABW5GA12_9PSEU